MLRNLLSALVMSGVMSSVALAQDGPLQQIGRALDNTGRNVRNRVETEIARGQARAPVVSQERDVLRMVLRRIEWDKRFVGSVLRLESRPDGAVIIRGSVRSEEAKLDLVELVENTVGVSTVTAELAVSTDKQVIQSEPTVQIEAIPGSVETETRKVVVPPGTKVEVPANAEVIVKPSGR